MLSNPPRCRPVQPVPLLYWLILLCAFGLASAEAQLTNVALGKPVTASGPVYDALRAATMINDGSASTFTHPATIANPANFKYTIDLGTTQGFNKFRFINRTGCCPERLTNYRVSIFETDPEAAGAAAVWTTVVRANGTNSGDGGVDEVVAGAHAAGVFAGRYLRIQNLLNLANHPQVAEFEALASPNLALYKKVTASAAVAAGFAAANLTDGNPATSSYPDGAATTGFYFDVDLAGDFSLDRLVLYARQDSFPERLRNYRVTLLADNAGVPGAVRWTGDLRTDGSFPEPGAGEVIRAAQGTGDFKGRFVRITNLGGEPGNPQMAEVEAYRAVAPVIRYFTTDAGNITKTGAPGLPGQAVLSWDVEGATSVTVSQGIGAVETLTGSRTVSPSSATIYMLTATNIAGSVSDAILIEVDAAAQSPKINEIMADNEAGLEDEDGDRVDWIELYNPNIFTLPLAGACLSDNPAIPNMWTFPAGAAIRPGGYLVVFASGKNRTVPTKRMHTNFELKKSGEAVTLHAPGGTLLWSRLPGNAGVAAYPAQTRDTSYGIDGVGFESFFRPATPGGVNATMGFSSVVADTSFSPPRGFYNTPQTVSITTATPGAVIRYTLNGTRPTDTTGTVYAGPLTISATTVLRAAAFLAGAAPTNVDTHTYIFPNSVQTQGTMQTSVTNNVTMGPQIPAALTDLPSISLTMPSTAAVNQDSEVETAMEWLDPANPPGHLKVNAGITYYGGAFTTFNKRSYRLYFRTEYGDRKLVAPLFAGHEHGLSPATEFDSLELRTGSHDMSMRGFYMSNLFTDQLMMEMGHVAPHGRMVHVYINVVYWGMYHMRERWNAAMHADYLGGGKSDYEAINGNQNVGGWANPGTAYDGTGEAWEYIKARRAFYPELRGLVDVVNYTDYMITFMFGNSEDEWRSVGPSAAGMGGSGARFILNDADGWLSINSSNSIASWDGNDNNTTRSSTWNAGTGVFTAGRNMGDGPGSLLSALYLAGGTEYRMLLADRIHKHMFGAGVLTPSKNDARLRAMCTPIERAFIPESARWGYDFSQNRTWASWKGARDVCLASWIPNRTATVLSQFRTAGFYPSLNAPVFTQNGGTFAAGYALGMSVTSLPAGGVIHYTLDGSDPRLPGGAVAGTALTYSAPVGLSVNTLVRARTRTLTGVWSALQEAFFMEATSLPVPAGAVLPGEIHFNPTGDDDAEFLELVNVSNGAVNLRGCRFTAGIDFAFSSYRDAILAPGQRLVLVDSESAHRKTYGWDRTIAGIYRGNLSNSGDTLTLMSDAVTVFDFGFNGAWQPLADGGGFSLTMVHPKAGLNLVDPANWRLSSVANGTPGIGDGGVLFTGVATADADGDGVNAFMEYALGGSDAVADPTAGLAVGQVPGRPVRFSYHAAASADDALVIPEVSADLTGWHADASWLVPDGQEKTADGGTNFYFVPGPALTASGGRAFFHVRVLARP
ncbi:MAG: hypothetical protein JWL81_1639 [Verrucomicrobiales bacterium]|nr:hypothetical protein [Verrucomicrobiales bacterium]